MSWALSEKGSSLSLEDGHYWVVMKGDKRQIVARVFTCNGFQYVDVHGSTWPVDRLEQYTFLSGRLPEPGLPWGLR